MTALTKNTFTLPNLGTMFHALNKGSAKKAGTAQSTDGVLVPCQWDSLSDVRRHRPSKYVHQIRLVESPGALELRMMHFKAPKDSAKNQRIDASSAVMHSLRIERNSQGGVRLVRFGASRGADANVPVPFTQTLEGKMAQQFVSTFARGWVGAFLSKKEMARLQSLTRTTFKKPDMNVLMESTSIMVERAASMHLSMLQSYDNPAVARALDQAVLFLYEKSASPEDAAQRFQVDALDVASRKRFFDKSSDALGKPAAQMVVEHLLASEKSEDTELAVV